MATNLSTNGLWSLKWLWEKKDILLLYNIYSDGVRQLRVEDVSLKQKQNSDVNLKPTSFSCDYNILSTKQ